MAITATLLTDFGSNANVSSFATSSISPGANRLLLCVTHGSFTSSTGQNTPTCSGNGLTWEIVDTVTAIGAGVMQRLTVFRAMGASPTSGGVTVSYGGQNQQNAIIYVIEFDGVDTSGANGSGAVVQVANNAADAAATSLTVTLAAFGDATNNVTFGAFAIGDNVTLSAGSGFTAFTQNTTVTESGGARCEWRTGEDTSVDMTWSNTAGRRGIALEIKAAAAGGGDYLLPVLAKIRGRMRSFLRTTAYKTLPPLYFRSSVNQMLDIGMDPPPPGSPLPTITFFYD